MTRMTTDPAVIAAARAIDAGIYAVLRRAGIPTDAAYAGTGADLAPPEAAQPQADPRASTLPSAQPRKRQRTPPQ